jgi:hypothetical protein
MIIAAAVLSGFFGFRFFIHRPSPWQHKTRRQTPPKVHRIPAHVYRVAEKKQRFPPRQTKRSRKRQSCRVRPLAASIDVASLAHSRAGLFEAAPKGQ